MSTTRYARLREPHGVEFAPLNLTPEELTAGGYLPYKEVDRPEPPTDGTMPHNYSPNYVEKDGYIVREWKAYPNYEAIEQLKKQLDGTDYKVIKCYEASLVGADAPYDVNELHQERQEIRDEINRLEVCGNE